MTQKQNEKVQNIVRETIEERFSLDEFVFDCRAEVEKTKFALASIMR